VVSSAKCDFVGFSNTCSTESPHANPDRQSNALIGRIGQAWQELPEGSCRTITFDRGTEFAAYALLARASGTEAFFCDPHSPWQKGAIENTNGRIRQFLPGDRNLAELQRVTAMLNATPRRCLSYQTPNEAFQHQLAALPLTSPSIQ
jgi:IS30 family transposase